MPCAWASPSCWWANSAAAAASGPGLECLGFCVVDLGADRFSLLRQCHHSFLTFARLTAGEAGSGFDELPLPPRCLALFSATPQTRRRWQSTPGSWRCGLHLAGLAQTHADQTPIGIDRVQPSAGLRPRSGRCLPETSRRPAPSDGGWSRGDGCNGCRGGGRCTATSNSAAIMGAVRIDQITLFIILILNLP